MPFLEQVNKQTPKKPRFCNWNKYDRRDALKDFIHFNSIRNQEVLYESYEVLDDDPKVRNYLMTAEGQYSKLLQDGIDSYVKNMRNWQNTDLRRIKHPKPKHIMENSNLLSLVIRDYYKFGNHNPMADVFDAWLGGNRSKFDRLDYERQMQKERFRKLVELEKRNLRRNRGEKVRMMRVMTITVIKWEKKYQILKPVWMVFLKDLLEINMI